MMLIRFSLTAAALLALANADSHAPDPNVTNVLYDDSGFELMGYVAYPDANEPVPALVFIPDWGGVDLYEKQRATMAAAELGYVGFAADIYGTDYEQPVPDAPPFEIRRNLTGFYRGDPTLFTGRIQAAVNLVKEMDEVDENKVAIAGYCFGGTGVLMYALLGINDVNAVISFHGGLTSLPAPEKNVTPKVLVLSGGADDTSTAIVALENTFNNASAHWEITRYSDIEHGFTNFHDPRYNELADMRSWMSMAHMLKEEFGEISFDDKPPASIEGVQDVPYEDSYDGKELQGYLALPDATIWQTPAPGVVILPNWDNVNQFEKERAVLLAEAGYVAFAADIYGADMQENIENTQRFELYSTYTGDMDLYVARMKRAVEELQKVSEVDPTNIAIVGYCFGGTGAIQYAFSGRDDVKAVVPVHGGLQTLPNISSPLAPYTLILSGGDDDAHGDQVILEQALNDGNATWEITRYAFVRHGFTSWGSGAYNLNADARSWESMMTIFQYLMPIPMRALTSSPIPTNAPTLSPTQTRTSPPPTEIPSSSPMATSDVCGADVLRGLLLGMVSFIFVLQWC